MKIAHLATSLCWAITLMACQEKKVESTPPVTTRWKCSRCNEWHTELPFTYGPLRPDPYLAIPEAERAQRAVLDRDFCIIDGQHYFVRGRIEIPVRDSSEVFAWDVWVSLSKANYNRTRELLKTASRESEPPYFGWLCTNLGIYPDTTNLKTHVHTRKVGEVPLIELEPTDHPLAVEQQKGINLERVKEIAALILHPEQAP